MINNEQRDLQLSAIILAYGSLHYSDVSIEKTFELTINHLYQLFKMNSKIEYLHVALLHIRAYLQMGMVYENYQELFDKVLDCLNLEKKEVFSKYFCANKLIKLTRPQVRSMIGKWMPSSKNPKKIGEVVDEIIARVSKREKGLFTYIYSSGKNEYIYELVISEEQCFFHDVRKRKYYFFDI